MSALVSIVVTTFSRPKYLRRAVESVFQQSYKEIEVIVVDDNGPKSTARKETEEVIYELLKGFPNNNLLYIQHVRNLNGAAARNTGISAAGADYVGFLDDDDEFYQKKIELQMEKLLHEGADAVYCKAERNFHGRKFMQTEYTKEGDCTKDIFLLKSEILTPTLIFKKQSLNEIGGFDETFRRHQDYEMLIRYFRNHKIVCFPEVLVRINVESEINRPNVDLLFETKNKLLKKYQDILEGFTKKEQREIYKAQMLEMTRTALRTKDLRAIKFLLHARPSVKDLLRLTVDICREVFKRIKRSP